MLTFSAVLSALGLAPKTLPQANETLTAARAQLDSVNALFTAAGLPLEQMLATGTDALKAHLASLDKSADVTRLTAELETATSEAARIAKDFESAALLISAHKDVFASVGLAKADTYTAKDFKAAYEAHVAKATTLALAQTGHPPAHVPAQSVDDVTPVKTDTDIVAAKALQDYEALITADNAGSTAATRQAKTDFYAKHHAEISRGITLRRRS